MGFKTALRDKEIPVFIQSTKGFLLDNSGRVNEMPLKTAGLQGGTSIGSVAARETRG